jgi:S-adenosylmethionine uptake transporter
MARRAAVPFAAACVGIALYSVMDAVMKGLVLALGVYVALFWRLAAGATIMTPLFLLGRPTLPSRRILRLHLARSAVIAVMAIAFFWGIARMPLANAIALTFIAPLIALGLAAIFLKERIGWRSIAGSLLGLAGVGVILTEQLGAAQGGATLAGMAAVLLSAVFYAVNLVLARHQAQHAGPIEIAFFQNWFILGILCLFGPGRLTLPDPAHVPAILIAASLALLSLLLLSWAYARAEAQALLTVEYTAFVWAAIMGRLFFDERVGMLAVTGTALIVAGCLIAARNRAAEAGAQPEAALP